MKSSEGSSLLGLWRTDREDQWSLREYGDVSLRFEENGKLTYTIHLPNKDQVLCLTYKVEGTWLLTDQPSSPQVERTEFSFTFDGRLVVKNPSAAPPTFYVRQR